MTPQDLESFHVFSKAVSRLEDRINLLMKENQELKEKLKHLEIMEVEYLDTINKLENESKGS